MLLDRSIATGLDVGSLFFAEDEQVEIRICGARPSPGERGANHGYRWNVLALLASLPLGGGSAVILLLALLLRDHRAAARGTGRRADCRRERQRENRQERERQDSIPLHCFSPSPLGFPTAASVAE